MRPFLLFALAGLTACAAGPDALPDDAAAAETASAPDAALEPTLPSIPASALPGALPPGAPAFPEPLTARLAQAWTDRQPDYRPRTEHLRQDGSPRFTNRLYLETSPYLLQHAHNPVNWFPWGDEAFALAKELGRPVLLSVGYSTCHWCHVMEEESFEDAEIAAFINANYVAIKVDREERPDVDAVYMTAVQAMTGGGGWPMTVWLTPAREPFFGGTYFPARDGERGARMGFLTLLHRLHDVHSNQPDLVAQNSAQLVDHIRESMQPPEGGAQPGVAALKRAAVDALQGFDAAWGGREGRPKFPSSFPIRALLRHARRSGEVRAKDAVDFTLRKMAAGGMYDQVGGGFHRYSVDSEWLVPHFEKMLYDNAQLVVAYLEGFQATGDPEHARVAREVLAYVARDMTAPGGAFYSATDADSTNPEGEREEGWFFTWTPAELRDVLGSEVAARLGTLWGVTPPGNFEGRTILHRPRPLADVVAELGVPQAQLEAEIAAAREALYQARGERPKPLRDDKVLAAWNGQMISAFALGGLVLGEPHWIERAGRAADFVLANLRQEGRLHRAWKDGRLGAHGFLDDHAFLCAGLLDLFEVTGELRWLDEALALDAELEKRFEDAAGGWFVTANDAEGLLVREKPTRDGAQPSGTSVHTLNLLRLGELTSDDRYRQRADAALRSLGAILERFPLALSELLLALDFTTDRALEIVIVTPEGADAGPLLQVLRGLFVPNRVLVQARPGDAELAARVPLVAGKVAQGGQPTAYVCENGACKWPTTDPATLREQLSELGPY